MKPNCYPEWRRESLPDLYRHYSLALRTPYFVYVESLDRVCDDVHVLGLLQEWGLVGKHLNTPIITELEGFVEVLDIYSFFGGYDTIWLIEPTLAYVQPPSFMTWYGGESVGGTPKDKQTGQDLASWDPVASWMADAKAIVGLSSGHYSLVIKGQQLVDSGL